VVLENELKVIWFRNATPQIIQEAIKEWVQDAYTLEKDVELGYPYLKPVGGQVLPQRYLSISHSQTFGAVAIAPSPVGIDLEPIDRSVEKVWKRIVHDDEAATHHGMKKPIQLWCAKEALSKAIGIGMRHGLKGFTLEAIQGPIVNAKIVTLGAFKIHDPAVYFMEIERMMLAIAAEASLLRGRLRLCNFNGLGRELLPVQGSQG